MAKQQQLINVTPCVKVPGSECPGQNSTISITSNPIVTADPWNRSNSTTLRPETTTTQKPKPVGNAGFTLLLGLVALVAAIIVIINILYYCIRRQYPPQPTDPGYLSTATKSTTSLGTSRSISGSPKQKVYEIGFGLRNGGKKALDQENVQVIVSGFNSPKVLVVSSDLETIRSPLSKSKGSKTPKSESPKESASNSGERSPPIAGRIRVIHPALQSPVIRQFDRKDTSKSVKYPDKISSAGTESISAIKTASPATNLPRPDSRSKKSGKAIRGHSNSMEGRLGFEKQSITSDMLIRQQKISPGKEIVFFKAAYDDD